MDTYRNKPRRVSRQLNLIILATCRLTPHKMFRMRGMLPTKARKSEGVRRTFSYAAMTEGATPKLGFQEANN